MLIQSLIETPDEVERAARRQAELEKLCLAREASPAPVAWENRRHRGGAVA